MGDNDSYLARASAALEMGRVDEAKSFASQAIAQDPNNPNGHITMAWALIDDDARAALESAERAIALAPDEPRAFDAAASAALANKNEKKALDYVKRYRDLRPNSSRANRQHAEVLLEIGKPKKHRDEALASANEAIRLAPNSSSAFTTLGRVQMIAFSDRKKATESFNKALEADPNDSYAKRQLAFATETGGDKASALSLVQSVIRLDPTNQYARRQLDDIVLGFMSDLLWVIMLLAFIAAAVIQGLAGT